MSASGRPPKVPASSGARPSVARSPSTTATGGKSKSPSAARATAAASAAAPSASAAGSRSAVDVGGDSLLGSMGLKQFSRAVWQKVMTKKTTTADDVAEDMIEELKNEALASASQKVTEAAKEGITLDAWTLINPQLFDDRNVRRRVYDALNVLTAVGVVEKDKVNRTLHWRGLPNKSQSDIHALEQECRQKWALVLAKRKVVRDLILQQLAMRRLLQKNKFMAASGAAAGAGAASATAAGTDVTHSANTVARLSVKRVPLPFVLLTASTHSTVRVLMDTPGRRHMTLQFNSPFKLIDFKEVLRAMRLQTIPAEELHICVPPHLLRYVMPGPEGVDDEDDPAKSALLHHLRPVTRQVPSAPGSTVRSTAHATSAGENLLTSADATPSGSARSSSRRRGLDAGTHS